jgi:ribosomal protein S18 acetylase RimI-like enzyme
VIEVEPLRARDAATAGLLLAASHGEYPAFRALFPDPEVRARVLRPFMTGAARDTARYGCGLVARLPGLDGLAGVALWMPPGRFPLSAVRKARMTPALTRAAIAAGRGFGRFAQVGAALERAVPDGPAWYLQTLGVHPGAQRRGVGAALLADGLARADSAGLPCHLHTSDPANLEYYRRWGFALTQPEIRADADAPPYFGMTRPASVADSG